MLHPLPRSRPTPAASRYSRLVDLEDLNNPQTLAVLLVPPGTQVLDIGAADGSVAAALTARGCSVTAVEIDPVAAAAAEQRCDRAICGDAEMLDLDAMVGGERFDIVLLLDVLEHLRHPGDLLRRVAALLRPYGQMIASIPNVAHAAVRLALLQGRFPRTDVGLLDRTHLHFFDRAGVEALFDEADVHIMDVLTVARRPTETEIAVDVSSFSPEIVRAATEDPDSQTYQFVVLAGGRCAARALARGTLVGRLQASSRALERERRSLEDYARGLERAIEERDRQIAVDEAAIVSAKQAAAAAAAARDRLAIELERQANATATHEAALQAAQQAAAAAVAARDRLAIELEQQANATATHEAALRAAQQTIADVAATRDRLALELGSQATRASVQDAAIVAAQRATATATAAREALGIDLDRQRMETAALEEAHRNVETYARSLEDAVRTSERALADARVRAAYLRRDVALKDAYIMCLRERMTALEEIEAAAQRVPTTPRYWIADRVNLAIKRLPLIHRALRSTFVRMVGAAPRS